MTDQNQTYATQSRLVFVGGLHRSGTTLLARTLAAHQDVSGFKNTGVEEDEGQHLQDVMPTGKRFGGPGRFALDPASAMTERSPLATKASAERLMEQWARYWDLTRPILVEKSPPNLVRMRFLQTLFPDAAFIIIIRHPVIVTLATKKWAPHYTYESVFENWFRAHETMWIDAPAIQRLHVLKYEHLIARTEEVLTNVSEFLDLDGQLPSDLVQGGRSSAYEETWASWKTTFEPQIRRRYDGLMRRFGERAERFGYRLDDFSHVGDLPSR